MVPVGSFLSGWFSPSMRAHRSSIPLIVHVVSWLSASVYNAETREGEDEEEETVITWERDGTAAPTI